MAKIQAFRAIRPHPKQAEPLLFGNDPLKAQLETVARTRPETAEGQASAFALIRLRLQALMQQRKLVQDKKPGIYVYQLCGPNYRQTGIWCMTSLEDYRDGTIKTHEGTLADSERRLKNYRDATGLEGSPVLLTYRPQMTVNRIIAETRLQVADSSILDGELQHRLWKIDEPQVIDQLVSAFAQIRNVYLADGHHRLASAVQSNFSETISSLYVATDQLRIGEYHRVVIPDRSPDPETFFEALRRDFYLAPLRLDEDPVPRQDGHIGLFFQGKWINLVAKPGSTVDRALPDTLLLQQRILAPAFGISDPGRDTRLKCVGGKEALTDIRALTSVNPEAIAFTLCPTRTDDLIHYVNSKLILPPKSTWIEPKVPYGLLLFQHLDAL